MEGTGILTTIPSVGMNRETAGDYEGEQVRETFTTFSDSAAEDQLKYTIRNLDLFYDKTQALKNINMDIKPNQVTAMIGPSGCGKSTLLRTLNRMNDLVEGCRVQGKVLLDGTDIYGDIDVNQLRRNVGMVFQQPNPFPMSIYDNVAYGPRNHGERNKEKLDQIV